MSIEDASRCVEGSIELYIELYIEDVEARTQGERARAPKRRERRRAPPPRALAWSGST